LKNFCCRQHFKYIRNIKASRTDRICRNKRCCKSQRSEICNTDRNSFFFFCKHPDTQKHIYKKQHGKKCHNPSVHRLVSIKCPLWTNSVKNTVHTVPPENDQHLCCCKTLFSFFQDQSSQQNCKYHCQYPVIQNQVCPYPDNKPLEQYSCTHINAFIGFSIMHCRTGICRIRKHDHRPQNCGPQIIHFYQINLSVSDTSVNHHPYCICNNNDRYIFAE